MVTANLPNPRSGVVAPATTAAMPRPSGYLPPARPIANSASLATNPSQSGFPSVLPQPTDPRRAAAAKLANPTPATQIGRYPGPTGIAPAAASGSGQYPMAATGLGVAGGSGQFGAALPADPRPDPRKAARGGSAFRPAGGFPGLLFSYCLTHVILSVPCHLCNQSFCIPCTSSRCLLVTWHADIASFFFKGESSNVRVQSDQKTTLLKPSVVTLHKMVRTKYSSWLMCWFPESW